MPGGSRPRFGALLIALLLFIVTLTGLHAGTIYCWYSQACGALMGLVDRVGYLFDLNREGNLPTWFSTVQLLLVALSVRTVGRGAREAGEWALPWNGLAVLFVYLSLDEATDLHFYWGVGLSAPESAADLYAWLVPGIVLSASVGLAYLRWVLSRAPRVRVHFIAAGAVYVLGAIGFEYVGSLVVDETFFNLPYLVASTIEEVLEMLGVLIMLRGVFLELDRRGLRLAFGFDA